MSGSVSEGMRECVCVRVCVRVRVYVCVKASDDCDNVRVIANRESQVSNTVEFYGLWLAQVNLKLVQ